MDSTLSVSGIQHICNTKIGVIRRGTWIFVLATCSAWMMYNLYNRVVAYLDNPKSVNMEFLYKRYMEFPVVTICNINQFRAPNVYHYCSHDYCLDATDKFNKWYDTANEGNYEFLNDFNAIMQARTDGYYNTEAEYRMSQFQFPENYSVDFERFYNETAHTKENMIKGCTWKGNLCSSANFTHIFTDAGMCFTFNSNENETLFTNIAGSLGGLSLILDVEQSFYMLDDTSAAGIQVLIHHHDEAKHLVKNLAYFVSAGFHTNIALSYTKYDELPPPDGICNKDTALSECLLNCLSQHVRRKCKCREMYMTGNVTACSPYDILMCSWSAPVEIASNTTISEECACSPKCERISHTVAISQAMLSVQRADVYAANHRIPQWR